METGCGKMGVTQVQVAEIISGGLGIKVHDGPQAINQDAPSLTLILCSVSQEST